MFDVHSLLLMLFWYISSCYTLPIQFCYIIFRFACMFKVTLAILLLQLKRLEQVSKRYLVTSYLLFKISEKLACEYLKFSNIYNVPTIMFLKLWGVRLMLISQLYDATKETVTALHDWQWIIDLNLHGFNLSCLQEYPDLAIWERSSVYCCNIV